MQLTATLQNTAAVVTGTVIDMKQWTNLSPRRWKPDVQERSSRLRFRKWERASFGE